MAIPTGGLTISNEYVITVVTALCGVISWLGIRFAKVNERIVNSYFEDQKSIQHDLVTTADKLKDVGVALKESSDALASHSKQCLDGQGAICKMLSENTKAIHEHDVHMTEDRRKVAEALMVEDAKRASSLIVHDVGG